MKNTEFARAGMSPVKWMARSIILALVIAVCAGFETTANATIILGNLPANNEQPGADVGFGTQEAVKFTMGSSGAVLGNVILRVKTNAGGTNIPSIDIRNDTGSAPGTTVLFTIDGTTALPISTGTATTVQDALAISGGGRTRSSTSRSGSIPA